MKYKLTYWDVRGRAEPIRLIFAAANVDYLDNRIKKETWPGLKPSMPWNQVPILQVENKVLAQSVTICRYLASEFNLVGSDSWGRAKCDEYVDAISDLLPEMKKIAHEKDESLKSKFKTDFLNNTMPKCLQKLENILKNKEGPFLVGLKLTWADIFVSNMIERLETSFYVGSTLLNEYPFLNKMKQATYNFPGVKTWIESRPIE